MSTWAEHLKALRDEFLYNDIMYNGTVYTVEDIDANGCIHIQMDGNEDTTAVYDEIEARKNLIHTLDEIDGPAKYIPDYDGDTFGQMRVNGTLYPVCLSLNPGIPDALCNSIEIDGTIYRFDAMQY